VTSEERRFNKLFRDLVLGAWKIVFLIGLRGVADGCTSGTASGGGCLELLIGGGGLFDFRRIDNGGGCFTIGCSLLGDIVVRGDLTLTSRIVPGDNCMFTDCSRMGGIRGDGEGTVVGTRIDAGEDFLLIDCLRLRRTGVVCS
jgi:hypothetical protein